MKKNSILTAAVFLGGAMLGASPAQALVSWNFSSTATPYGCVSADPSGCAGWNTTATYSGSGTDASPVVVRAFQNRADVNNTDPTSYTGNTYLQQTATNDFAGGLGAAPDIVNQDGIIDPDGWSPSTSSEGSDPYHTIENYGYNSEFVLFDFGKLTTLSDVSIGYIPTGWDSDMTVLAYKPNDGGGAGTDFAGLGLTSLTFNTMDDNGWQVVGNYGNVLTGSETINAGSSSSRWWAIGAYNPAFGATSANGGALGTGSCSSPCTSTAWDGFKIATVSGNYKNGGGGGSQVPAPGVIGLLGLGLVLMGWQRRRLAG